MEMHFGPWLFGIYEKYMKFFIDFYHNNGYLRSVQICLSSSKEMPDFYIPIVFHHATLITSLVYGPPLKILKEGGILFLKKDLGISQEILLCSYRNSNLTLKTRVYFPSK